MSAYLSSADCLNALATYWERKASQGASTAEGSILRALHCQRRATGATSGDYVTDLKDDEKACARILASVKGNPLRAVFGILLIENQNSLKARYPGDSEMWETTPEYVGRSLPCVDRWIQQRKTGEMVGLLNGYEYQACEHNEWERSLAFFICQQISSHLLDDLQVLHCPPNEYGSRGHWASFKAPADGPGPVRLSTLAKS